MRKYVGRFRVLCERDINGDPVDNDFTYLVGTRNYRDVKIYRYDEDKLKVYIPMGRISKLLDKMRALGVEILDSEYYDGEVDLIVLERDLPVLASIFEIKTTGANIKPESVKNHPRRDELRQARLAALSDEEREKLKDRGRMLRDMRKL